MIKIVHNNLIIDVCAGENYLRFLPNHKRFLSVERSLANAVIGSDNNTIYHIQGTPYNFLYEVKSVQVYEISEEEYNKLTLSVVTKEPQNAKNLKEEVDILKDMVARQNLLIEQLLNKLS
jgi:maltooligosyltrehalose synthase